MIAIDPLEAAQFAVVAKWLSDPEINRWLTAEWRGRNVEPAVLAVAARNKRNRLYLVKSAAEPCGLVALADIDAADRCAMIWYVLGERALGGKGVVSRAVNQLCRRAFAEHGLSCLYAWILAPNAPSRRVLEHNGFREAGALRRAGSLDGAAVDRVYFDLLPGDLAELPPT